VGPNGSGKSSVLQALRLAGSIQPAVIQSVNWSALATLGVSPLGVRPQMSIKVHWPEPDGGFSWEWLIPGGPSQWPTQVQQVARREEPGPMEHDVVMRAWEDLHSLRVYALDPNAIMRPVQLNPTASLEADGSNLVVMLDQLRDREPDQFDLLNVELASWFSEFDRVLFDTHPNGFRSFLLRRRGTNDAVRASDLSHGTLLALTLLALAYLPDSPGIIAVEEPERGLHPRLLADVADALRRVARPAEFGSQRPPRQVIATTHSPYLLDRFRDHLDEVVVAEKIQGYAQFSRLSERPDIDDVLRDVHLGEAWYTGVLGGVPVPG
jgi:predicted ATPase